MLGFAKELKEVGWRSGLVRLATSKAAARLSVLRGTARLGISDGGGDGDDNDGDDDDDDDDDERRCWECWLSPLQRRRRPAGGGSTTTTERFSAEYEEEEELLVCTPGTCKN